MASSLVGPIDPAGETTRPIETPNPPAVKLQEPPLDFTVKANYENHDRVFVQASPYIFRKKQGGWNAKLLEVDLEDHQTITASTHASPDSSQGQDNLLRPKERGEVSLYMRPKPTCTARRTSSKREVDFIVTDTNHPASDAKMKSNAAHASDLRNPKVHNHEGPITGIPNGIARDSGT